MVAYLLLFLLFLVGLIILFNVPQKIQNYYRVCKALKNIPELPTHWLWGNMHQIKMTQEFGEFMYEWRNKNNYQTEIMKYWIGPFDVSIAICHPTHLNKQVLKCPKAENLYGMIEPWLGPGVLIANGERWVRSRRLLTPAFHFDILKPYVHVYNECTDILLRKWQAQADNGQPVNVHETITRLTLDVILQCACSYKSGCQERIKDDYVDAVDKLRFLSVERFMSLYLQIDNFIYLYFTPQGWKYRKALKVAHEHSEKVIRQRKEALKMENGDKTKRRNSEVQRSIRTTRKYLDFLDILLTTEDDEGCGLTDLEIRNEVDTFMFEGHDTTANGITWTLYLLARHPEHQEKCREEIRNVLRGRDHLDYEDLSGLQYTLWCIKEAMRLFPPVFNIFRRLTEDTNIGEHCIPKGVWLTIDIMAIHLNPDIWENPREYNPLRFHPDNVTNRHPFAYIPFSAGQRNCIGQNFATNEELVVVGSIINRFSLEIVSKEEAEYLPIVILRPKNEIKLKITSLKKQL